MLTLSAGPPLTTDQNTPVTFRPAIRTSLADAYTLTAQAPTGWMVAIDATGNVTATPAPGLQGGTYPIQVIAQSTTNPDLVAQIDRPRHHHPHAPGITLAVAPDPLIHRALQRRGTAHRLRRHDPQRWPRRRHRTT